MKIIDYDQLHADFKPKGYISTEANHLANRIICDLAIPVGQTLASFLEVNNCYDNHRAVRIWVQRQLDDSNNYCNNDIYQVLKKKFCNSLPH